MQDDCASETGLGLRRAAGLGAATWSFAGNTITSNRLLSRPGGRSIIKLVINWFGNET
ncbi:hypothetical protein [Candidatus Nitrotoga sp. BS]|uniref:hypothetical protein n=1 Tax=Candidatus Nitrotoga sp. BS TaxID=2890408 RepID=UPI001EF1905E|nr:hypothetical protein [Candidatus Nitrotoga sp. BS]